MIFSAFTQFNFTLRAWAALSLLLAATPASAIELPFKHVMPALEFTKISIHCTSQDAEMLLEKVRHMTVNYLSLGDSGITLDLAAPQTQKTATRIYFGPAHGCLIQLY